MSGAFPAIGDSRIAVMVIVDPEDTATIDKLREILGDGALLHLPPDAAALAPRAAPLLTERQTAILRLLEQNLSNKEIGRALAISHFTVRNHVSQLLRIFDVATRQALIAAYQGYPVIGRYSPSLKLGGQGFDGHPIAA